jgi:predicted permease
MALVAIFLDTLAPVFVLVLVGYVAGTRLQFDPRTLSRLAYWVLAPAFVYHSFANATLELTAATRMAAFYTVVTGGSILAAGGLALLLRRPPQKVAAFILIAAFGNVGNFGLSVVQFASGAEALAVGTVYFLIGNFIGFVVGVLAATWHKGNRWGAVRSALLNPAVLAAVLAILLKQINFTFPPFLLSSIALVADSMIPIMLLALGVQFAHLGRFQLTWEVTLASVVRLVVSPALGFLLAGAFMLTTVERASGLIQASMPSAVFCALLAIENDLEPQFVTTAVFLSTLISALTLTVVLSLV